MGFITGTSTPVTSSTDTTILLDSPDLGYIVILLMVLCGIMLLDLMRRVFTRK